MGTFKPVFKNDKENLTRTTVGAVGLMTPGVMSRSVADNALAGGRNRGENCEGHRGMVELRKK